MVAADFTAAVASAVEGSTVEVVDSMAEEDSPAEATWASTAEGGRSPAFMVEVSLEATADGAAEDLAGVDTAGVDTAGVGEVTVGDGAGDLVGVGRGGAGVGDIPMATTVTVLTTTPIPIPAATTTRIHTTGAMIRHQQIIQMRGRGEECRLISTGQTDRGRARRSNRSNRPRRRSRRARWR